MKRRSYKANLILLASLLILMSISPKYRDVFRGVAAAALSPSWEVLHGFRISMANFFPIAFHQDTPPKSDEALLKIELENQLLKTIVRQLGDLLGDDLVASYEDGSEVIAAKVIFRSPSTWNSSLWINVGHSANKEKGKIIVAKNSPVVVGKSVVGVIDYLGENQSRVRLITDAGLTPSIRVLREDSKGAMLLAKGELQGSSMPLWRTESKILKGTGFNYDFADQEGPGRDLRTGKPLDQSKTPAIPIIKTGDLLVTTGMDGVFPAGLEVAVVTKIFPLREGDYYYELEAIPSAESLEDLTFVFILPPQGYNSEEQFPL